MNVTSARGRASRQHLSVAGRGPGHSVVFVLFALLPCSAAAAQTADVPCAERMRRAEVAYVEGDFARVPELAWSCAAAPAAAAADRIRAYRLMALASEYAGDSLAASAAAGAILQISPAFEPDPVNDPPVFVSLIAQAREQLKEAAPSGAAAQTLPSEPPPPIAGEEPSRTEAVLNRSGRGAIVRSALVPGLGQLYKDQPLKGSLFMAGSAVGLAAAGFSSLVLGVETERRDAAVEHLIDHGQDPGFAEAHIDESGFGEAVRTWTALRRSSILLLGAVWVANIVDSAISPASAGTSATPGTIQVARGLEVIVAPAYGGPSTPGGLQLGLALRRRSGP